MSNVPLVQLNPEQLVPLFDDLAKQGLVLASAVSVQQLPGNIWLDPAVRKNTGTLLLLGHAGRLFWECYQQSQRVVDDPVDHFSTTISNQVLQQHLPMLQSELLFPSADCPVNLMALGRELGWHTPSPLGMGINTQYGLWSAYRALWWLDAELAMVSHAHQQAVMPANTICDQCLTQDCLRACPGEALSIAKMPNLQKCADYRLSADSDCTSTCVARTACPFASEYRYTKEQMAYHYDLGRSQIHLFSSRVQQETIQGSSHG